jgi:hypothetical protein
MNREASIVQPRSRWFAGMRSLEFPTPLCECFFQYVTNYYEFTRYGRHTGGARTRSSARRAADTADAHQVRPGGMPRSMHAASCRRLASFTAPCPPAPHATLLPRGSLCHGLYHPAGVLWEGSRAHAAFRQSFVHLEPASGGHLAGHARACGARKGARRGKKEKRECGGAG